MAEGREATKDRCPIHLTSTVTCPIGCPCRKTPPASNPSHTGRYAENKEKRDA